MLLRDPSPEGSLQSFGPEGPLSTGEASPPQTPPNRRTLKGSPPLVVVGGFPFGKDAPRQFPRLALTGRPRELPRPSLPLLPPLEGSPGQGPFCNRSSSLHLLARPKGRPGELPPPLSTGEELCSSPDPSSNRRTPLVSSSTVCSRRLTAGSRAIGRNTKVLLPPSNRPHHRGCSHPRSIVLQSNRRHHPG